MTEPKQEYQTERKEPPNLRHVNCCGNCKHGDGWYDNCWCKKYYEHGDIVVLNICDDYEPEGEPQSHNLRKFLVKCHYIAERGANGNTCYYKYGY